jgi:hypothetical protein
MLDDRHRLRLRQFDHLSPIVFTFPSQVIATSDTFFYRMRLDPCGFFPPPRLVVPAGSLLARLGRSFFLGSIGLDERRCLLLLLQLRQLVAQHFYLILQFGYQFLKCRVLYQ